MGVAGGLDEDPRHPICQTLQMGDRGRGRSWDGGWAGNEARLPCRPRCLCPLLFPLPLSSLSAGSEGGSVCLTLKPVEARQTAFLQGALHTLTGYILASLPKR